MDPLHWKQLRALYDEVVDVPLDERDDAIRRACGGDNALADDLRWMLQSNTEADAVVDGIVAEVASTLLETSLEGAQIGPYRLVSEIGQGGMGAVYLAERTDGQFEQRVALKLVRPELTTPAFLRRFEAERQILARLQHPHIARLLDGGLDADGRPYFALEYVEGRPIDQYCDDRGLGVDERLALFGEVCGAVAYAHANLIVHRDLKPANILVGDDGYVRLLDFGIAKVLHEDDDEHGLTQLGVRAMTPEYASPEQVRGEAVGTGTDVYSLGVILYKLLTGARPYEVDGRTPAEVERIVCDTIPPRPSSQVREASAIAAAGTDSPGARPHPPQRLARGGRRARLQRRLRGDIDVICLKALQKDRARRYSSVDALQEDIRRTLAGLPVLARPDSLSYRAGKFVSRHRLSLSIAAVVVAGFVGFGAYHTARLADERDRAQSEAAKAEQVSLFLQGLFAVSDPSESKGETITARELLDEGAGRIERELASQPEVRASMMRLMGNVYHGLGLPARARPLLERALEDYRRLFGDVHGEVAMTELALATLLQDLGELEEAERLLRHGLEMRRQLLGERDPAVIEGMSMLAYLLETRGDVEGAERMARDVLTLGRTSLPAGDPLLAESGARLAGMLRRQGHLDEAEPLLRDALASQRAAFGDVDLDVASTARNLASLLRDRGTPAALEEAEALYQEAIAIRRTILGELHPEVAVALNSYAMLLDRKGEYEGAISQYRELIRILEQDQDGDSQSDLAAIYNNLAGAFRSRGRLDEAAATYVVAMQAVDQALDESHPNRAFSRLGLASVYMDQGQLTAAESLMNEALQIRRAGLPAGHRYIGDTLVELGDCLTRQGKFAEAEAVLLEARDMFREGLGDDDARTQRAGRRLDALYDAWGGKPRESNRGIRRNG